MEPIKSTKNPKVILARSLKEKKYRDEYGSFLIEGKTLIKEALNSSFIKVETLFYTKETISDKIPVFQVSEKVMAVLSDTKTPQGLVAIAKKPDYRLKEKKNPFYLICWEIQDPGNLGTIIRTAEASGMVDAVLVSSKSVDPFNPKVVRSSMGGLFHLPVIEMEELPEDVRLIATDLKAKKDYRKISYQGAIGILIGNEAQGLSEKLLSLVDERVKIPLKGKVQSLNAAVSAALMIYQAINARI